jgi:predicted Zn-dependent protease
MEVLKSASNHRGGPDIFQTHPNPDLRIKEIKENLQKNPRTNQKAEGYYLRELYANPSLTGQKEDMR